MHCPPLTPGFNLSDGAVKAAATACGPALKSLDLSGCGRLTDLALKHVSAKLPNLEVLGLACTNDSWDFFSDRGLRHLSRGCNRLRWLDLTRNNSVTHKGVTHLATLPFLEMLQLRGCVMVEDSVCNVLAQHDFDSLKVVDMTECHGVTNSAVLTLLAVKPELVLLSDDRETASVEARLLASAQRPDKAECYQSRAQLMDWDPSVWRSSTERLNARSMPS